MIPQKVYHGDNIFHFLNAGHTVSAPGDWNRQEWGKLWLYNLHYFDWLKQPDLPEQEGNRWIQRWIDENPVNIGGNGWEPYPVSLRIVNWIKWHLSGHTLNDRALESLSLQVRYLRGKLEKHLLANHYLANAKALVFAGMFFTGDEAAEWLITGCEIYREQLPEQILADGGHFERSPMYHSIILEDLLDIYNLRVPLFLEDVIPRMLKYLAVMTGPDKRISLFNDAAYGIALSPPQLFAYANALGFIIPGKVIGDIDLPNSGYARLSDGNWTLICDGGNIGPDYQPGHAHADTLSFELWYGETKLLTNSGTGEYVDTSLRREQRGTAGHNTLTVDNRNSSNVWGAHRVAERAKIIDRHWHGNRFTATHDGYAPVMHQRRWEIAEGTVKIADTVKGNGTHEITQYWHFLPGTVISIKSDKTVEIELANQFFVLSVDSRLTLELVFGHFSPEFGLSLEHPVLKCSFKTKLPLTLITTLSLKEKINENPISDTLLSAGVECSGITGFRTCGALGGIRS